MELIKVIRIENPPTKYIIRSKIKIDKKTGKLKETVVYLTANVFVYSKLHFAVQKNIMQDVKRFLVPYLKDLPKLEKAKFKFIYFKNSTTWDLDNKSYFWQKTILDVLKTPTPKQLKRAYLQGRDIITVNVLKEDSVKFIDELHWQYKKGSHALEIHVYGELYEEPKDLFNS